MNHHQGATACALPKLQYWLQYTSPCWSIQYYGCTFRSVCNKGTRVKIQGDSKRWTQLNSKRRLNTRQTVGCGIPSSLFALRVDVFGLRSELSWIRLTFSSDTRGRPELLPYTDSLFAQIGDSFLVGGWMLKRRRNARCTAVGDLVLINSNAKNLVLHGSHFALNWRCCTAVRQASALAVVFENLGPPLTNPM